MAEKRKPVLLGREIDPVTASMVRIGRLIQDPTCSKEQLTEALDAAFDLGMSVENLKRIAHRMVQDTIHPQRLPKNVRRFPQRDR